MSLFYSVEPYGQRFAECGAFGSEIFGYLIATEIGHHEQFTEAAFDLSGTSQEGEVSACIFSAEFALVAAAAMGGGVDYNFVTGGKIFYSWAYLFYCCSTLMSEGKGEVDYLGAYVSCSEVVDIGAANADGVNMEQDVCVFFYDRVRNVFDFYFF